MEYIVDYSDKNGDYDSTSIFVEDNLDKEEVLCELVNSIISNKDIKEVMGIEVIEDRPFENDEEEEY